MKIVFFTNFRSELSLPVLAAIVESDILNLNHIIFYKNISLFEKSILKKIKFYGLLRAFVKIIQIIDIKMDLFFLKIFHVNIHRQIRSCYEYAIKKKLPFSIIRDVNCANNLDLLKQIKADIILVCWCGQILSKNLFEIANKGSINIHPSLLPRHRGPDPAFWTLFYGDKKSGCTFHIINEKIDDGKILAQFEVDINKISSKRKLYEKIFSLAAKNVGKVLNDYWYDRIIPQEQKILRATYEGFPSLQETKNFLAMGYKD